MTQIYLNGERVYLCTGYDVEEGWVRVVLLEPALPTLPTLEEVEIMNTFPDLVRVKRDSNGKPMDIFRYGKVEVRDV